MRLYDEAAQDITIHAARDEATWRYLLTHSATTETERDTYIIHNAGGKIAGYVCIPHHHFGEELVANEVSCLGFDAAMATLHYLKTLAVERTKPGIRLDLPADCTLMRLAHSFGAHDMGTYAWQIHVPSIAALLRALTPVLERRIAKSPFAGLSRDLRLDLYAETLSLRFKEGKLAEIAQSSAGGGDIRFPPLQFIPLVLGYRTLKELQAVYPDIGVTPPWHLLVDTLFPRMTSFIYTNY